MKPRSETFSFLVGIAALAGTFYVFYRLVAFLIATLYALNPSVSGPVVAAVLAIIGSVLVSVIGKYLEKTLAVEAAFREKRLRTYSEFIVMFYGMGSKSSEDYSDKLREINKEMILWAGPDLLRAYVKFFRQAAKDSKSGKMFLLLEDFLKAIRIDLGHSNNRIVQGEILSLVVKPNELDEFLVKIKSDPNYRVGT
jgi:hypothetical protein